MSDRRVNIGVIGAGGIARRRTIPGMLAAGNCNLVAVMNPSRSEEIAREFGVPRAYAVEDDLLADPDVEAVYIASPVHCHARQIEAAAEAGKHILCEKPLARTFEGAERAMAACEKHGVLLQEGYMMKFHGAHAKIKEVIDSGAIGTIVSMRAQLACWYPEIEGSWRQDPETGGGGALIDMATHLYDLLQWFAGPVRRIAALTSRLVHEYRSEDTSTTLLEFSSGAHATVDCHFCIPDDASRTRLEIYGSKGALLSEGTIGQGDGGTLEGLFEGDESGYDAAQRKDDAKTFRPITFDRIDPFMAECRAFASSVLAGAAPRLNDGQNALSIMKLVAPLAYDSAETNRIRSTAEGSR